MIRRTAVVLVMFATTGAFAPGWVGADPTEEKPPQWADVDPSYAIGKLAIELKDWATAIRALSSVADRDRNADVQNYLGYAYRNLGRLDTALHHYDRALELDPRHRGAHEYIGEAFLIVGNLPKAEEHLAALARICPTPCEEYLDLKNAIAEYRRRAAR